MDPIGLFSAVQPPAPADDELAQICQGARERVAAAKGQPSRHRRPRAFALGGGVVAAAASAAIALLASNAAYSGATLRSFVTAAYSVRPDGSGTIIVTIKELRDPTALQRALTADGVHALVRYIGERNVSGTYHGVSYDGSSPECQYLNLHTLPAGGGLGLGPGPASGHRPAGQGRAGLGLQGVRAVRGAAGRGALERMAGAVFWIRPSELPKGSVVFIEDGQSITSIDLLASGKLPRCVPTKPPTPAQIVDPQDPSSWTKG
jgi:hypothetical protein